MGGGVLLTNNTWASSFHKHPKDTADEIKTAVSAGTGWTKEIPLPLSGCDLKKKTKTKEMSSVLKKSVNEQKIGQRLFWQMLHVWCSSGPMYKQWHPKMSFGYLQSHEMKKKKKLKTIIFYSRHYNNINSNYVLHYHDLQCLYNLLEMTAVTKNL